MISELSEFNIEQAAAHWDRYPHPKGRTVMDLANGSSGEYPEHFHCIWPAMRSTMTIRLRDREREPCLRYLWDLYHFKHRGGYPYKWMFWITPDRPKKTSRELRQGYSQIFWFEESIDDKNDLPVEHDAGVRNLKRLKKMMDCICRNVSFQPVLGGMEWDWDTGKYKELEQAPF